MRIRPRTVSIALLSLFLLVSSIAAFGQSNTIRPRVTRAVDMRNLITLRGNVHPLARPEFDQGVAPDDLPMARMLLVLQRGADQEASLRQMLDQQQVKSSMYFHQWLTPEQFGQQYGPADSDLQAVTNWLSSQGFQVTKVAVGRNVIEFSGTAGLVRQVLGTEIHKFRVNGADHWANTRDPQIPEALAPVVAGIDSLNNFPRKSLIRNLGTFRKVKATGKVTPLVSLPTTCPDGSDNCDFFAVGPADFATIYNVAPLYTNSIDGTNQTIAVVGETNIDPQDVRNFRNLFGLPANATNIILNGPDPGITSVGEETEADLDVEWTGAVAKGATIDFVVSETTEATAGIDLSALYIIDNNLAPVMSESYGECEAGLGTAGNQFHSQLWEQAAAEGITVLMAAGDSGSAVCDSGNTGEIAAQFGLAVSGYASTPFDVAVGGTSFNFDSTNVASYWARTNTPNTFSSALSYIPETTWNDSCSASGSLIGCTPPPSVDSLISGAYLFAGSGGPSSCINPTFTNGYPGFTCSGGYAKPSWQTGTGVPHDNARDVPDVSLMAGGTTAYVVCQSDATVMNGGSPDSCDLNSPYIDFESATGTSASAQVFAGIMSLVVQAHGRQGNANYVLYPMAAQSGATCDSNAAAVTNSSCIFYDTTVGNNSVICAGGSLNCSASGGGNFGILVSGNPLAPAYAATTGYDLATGLGTVNASNLVTHWASNFTPPAVTLQLSTNPATTPIALAHGQPVNFSIGVTAGSGTPSGDVSLFAQAGSGANNMTAIGPFTLSGGNVSGSTVMLPGGSYNVTAHYEGNGAVAAGDSSPGVPVTVGKETSVTVLHLVTTGAAGIPSYSATTLPYGSPYVLRMDITNSSGQPCAPAASSGRQYAITYACPSGTLTVSPTPTDVNAPSNTIPGSYTLNSQGYAEDQPIQQPAGQYNFTASYSGDVSYLPSITAAPLAITITQAPTTLTTSGLPSTVVTGTQLVVNATLTTQSSGAGPTGTIQLMNNGFPLGSPVAVHGIGAIAGAAATAQVALFATLPVGNASISAQYSGDVNYTGSTSSPTALTVSDFSISANPPTVNISAPGQSGSTSIGITPIDGFNATINLSIASGCPTAATCALSTSSVNVSAASPAAVTLNITTRGSASMTTLRQPKLPPSYHQTVRLLGMLAGLLILAFLLVNWEKRWHPAVVPLAGVLLVAGFWIACGNSGTSNLASSPGASLSATRLTFASQNDGTTSAAQSVTLSNTGTSTLNIASITLTGANSGDFSETTSCGRSLAASANCSISAQFAPTAGGARNAAINISDNANGSPQTISLTGTGVSEPTPTGSYPVVINAVSGGDTHTLTVNVIVQ